MEDVNVLVEELGIRFEEFNWKEIEE